METASCTARRLLISSDTLKNFRNQSEWIRDVTYQLWSLHPIASRMLTHLTKLYEELNLINKIPQPSSDLCREPTSWNCVFQFNWARLVCWTRNLLIELHHQADIIENSELSLNLHHTWLPFVRERLLAVNATASVHEIDVDFFSKEFDRLASLYLELIGEKGCQVEEINRKLQWIRGDLSTNNNGLLFDRLLDREQQLWSAYQSLKLQVEQRRHLACQQFMQFVERLSDERTSTDQLLTKWHSDLFKRLKVLKLSLLQMTSSSVVLRLNEPGAFSKTTDLTIHVVIKPRDLNGRIRELDRWLCTMRQQLDYHDKTILNTWHQWEMTESALDRSEGELDFLIQSVSHFRPLPLIENHSECPRNYLLRSVGRIKHLITDRTECWRTHSESEKRSASETVTEWSKSEVYSQYAYIGSRLISYLQQIDRPTELITDVIQHIHSRLDTYAEIRTGLLNKIAIADKTLQQLLDQTHEFSRLCALCHQSLSYSTQKMRRELIEKEPDITDLDTHSTVILNEIPSLTRLVRLGFHQSVLAASSNVESPLGQLNSLVNEITNTADSQTSAYFHSAVHSLVKSFYGLYNLTTSSLTESQRKRSFWCYYERTFGELKLHSGYYFPPYNRNEYNTVLSKLFTLRTELTTLALQLSSPSVLADMDTVLSNPLNEELMTRMQLNDFNDIAETELQPEIEVIQTNNGKWTLDSLARLCAAQEVCIENVSWIPINSLLTID
ncbi:hypothetical protein EG68_04893 [Paragonimus skrjabini miyazakii]|uniref:Uncharacterized protein n=1 Tax=Paragonimus skrjabini miyazakii TaxID=59628 RepID=A0A8S9YXQ3_9TREM|nr:hypothetical protein EG68_04893 [Paragonimus skrjabini miyazakii]